ncbi:MAG: iron-sulfur cluster repair di-iron protein [Cyclonatronaceae bacterium]
MNTDLTSQLNEYTIAELVTADYRTAGVFRKFGLDFCCGGKKSVAEACEQKQLNTGEVLGEIEQVLSVPDGITPRFNAWSPELLIRYIIDNHHSYVREAIERIPYFINKVAARHGENHPWNIEIATHFAELCGEMTEHMASEENEVFPLIETYLRTKDPESRVRLEKLVDDMESEHSGAGALMARIRELSRQFTPPAGACNTYQVAYAELEAFERDLHQHVHLENNILFPKALNT